MKSYRGKGERIAWTNGTGVDVASDGLVLIGTIGVGVACTDIASTATGAVAVEGEFEVAKTLNEVWVQGDVLHLVNNTHKLSNVTGDAIAGRAAKSALLNATTGCVKLGQGVLATPADGSVTAVKLGASAVETAKINNLAVTAAKLAADAVETAKVKDKNVTGAKLADAVQDRIVTGTVTAGAEAVHARVITVQLKDSEGVNLAEARLIRLCVNATAALGAPAATATDTFGAPSAGAIHTTRTAKADYDVVTDATGKYVFELTHNDAGTSRFIDVFADSKPISSAEIAFDAV